MATMAAPGPSLLSVTGPDDTMELSSDAGNHEHDFDIDLMGSQADNNDADYMLEDVVSPSGAQAGDEYMQEDEDEITYLDETMPDDPVANAQPTPAEADMDATVTYGLETDETLYDLTEDVHEQNQSALVQNNETLVYFDVDIPSDAIQLGTEFADVAETEGSPNRASQAEINSVAVKQPELSFDVNPPSNSDHQEHIHTGHHAIEELAAGGPQQEPQLPGSQSDNHSSHADDAGDTTTEAGDASRSRDSQTPPRIVDADQTDAHQEFAQEHAQEHRPEATQKDAPEHDETPVNQAAFAFRVVHAVNLVFNDTSKPLFQSPECAPAEAFLQDPIIAHSTLADFFRACRENVDLHVDESQELELYVEELEMTVLEDSMQCMTTSLAQIIDVYVALLRSDGVDNPNPMTMYLTPRLRFSAQLTELFQAVSEGKGLSELINAQEVSFDTNESSEEVGLSTVEAEKPASGTETKKGQNLDAEVGSQELTHATGSSADLAQGAEDQKTSEADVDNKQQIETSAEQESEFAEGETQYFDADGFEDRDGQAENEDAEHDEDYGDREGLDQEHGMSAAHDESTSNEDRPAEEAGHQVGSSRSSTVEADTQPDHTREQPQITDDEEILIDFTDEDFEEDEITYDDDPIVEASAGPHSGRETQTVSIEQQLNPSTRKDTEDQDQNPDNGTLNNDPTDAEYSHDVYDEASLQADAINQNFNDFMQELDHEVEEQRLAAALKVDKVEHMELHGTFAVPDETDEGEDEINFDDEDELEDAGKEPVASSHLPPSPLGKRSREADDDGSGGQADGSDEAGHKRTRLSTAA